MKKILLLLTILLSIIRADYTNISLKELVEKASMQNSINILIDEELKDTITFYLNKRVTEKTSLELLKYLLKNKGLILLKQGDFYTIEEEKHKDIIKLQHIDAQTAVAKINELNTSDLRAKLLDSRHILLFYKKNEQRAFIEQILKKIDKKQKMYTITIDIIDADTSYAKKIGINFAQLGSVVFSSQTAFSSTNADNNTYNMFGELLEDNTKSKIIASPTLTIKENSSAIFKEGYTYPVKQKTTTIDKDETVYSNEEIKYKDIGLILNLRLKKVTEAGNLELEIDLQDTNILSYTNEQLTTTNRSIKTTVVTQKDRIVYLAGLGREKKIDATTGVPILKDIPLINLFFSTKHKETQNRSLLIAFFIKELK